MLGSGHRDPIYFLLNHIVIICEGQTPSLLYQTKPTAAFAGSLWLFCVITTAGEGGALILPELNRGRGESQRILGQREGAGPVFLWGSSPAWCQLASCLPCPNSHPPPP